MRPMKRKTRMAGRAVCAVIIVAETLLPMAIMMVVSPKTGVEIFLTAVDCTKKFLTADGPAW